VIRFFSILFGIVVLFFAVIFITRSWGLSQVEAYYEHPFFQKEVTLQLEIYKEVFLPEELSEKNYISVHKTEDGQLLVMTPEEMLSFFKIKKEEQLHSPQVFVFKGNKLSNYTLKEITEKTSRWSKLELFRESLCQNSKNRTIINIADNATNIDLSLVEFFDTCPKIGDQILISSRIGIVVTSIKTLRPRWLFGSSQDDWMRFLTYHSLYILPATPFKRDVYIAPVKYKKRSIINEDIINEMRRRNKKIVLGPIQNLEELEIAKSFKPDGLILSKFQLDSQHE